MRDNPSASDVLDSVRLCENDESQTFSESSYVFLLPWNCVLGGISDSPILLGPMSSIAYDCPLVWLSMEVVMRVKKGMTRYYSEPRTIIYVWMVIVEQVSNWAFQHCRPWKDRGNWGLPVSERLNLFAELMYLRCSADSIWSPWTQPVHS